MQRFIAGDWGTSRLRLSLMEGGLKASTVYGEGIANTESAEKSLRSKLAELAAQSGKDISGLPILLAGMAGAPTGLREAPYMACPADPLTLADALTHVEFPGHHVAIVPGLRGVNFLGENDVMRGEETQILGWLASEPSHNLGEYFLVLPGTHTKWVRVCDGRVTEFQTAMTGEIYALLAQHSILLHADNANAPFDGEAFDQGIQDSGARSHVALLHRLFSVRARRMTGALADSAAPSYLSGLMIGADMRSFERCLNRNIDNLHVIGSADLTDLYARAARSRRHSASVMRGSVAVQHGLKLIFDRWQKQRKTKA